MAYDVIGVGVRGLAAARTGASPSGLQEALGRCRRLLNVGAGAGSYEPADRDVIAVEPSRAMIAQRADAMAPCVQASAEALPFPTTASTPRWPSSPSTTGGGSAPAWRR